MSRRISIVAQHICLSGLRINNQFLHSTEIGLTFITFFGESTVIRCSWSSSCRIVHAGWWKDETEGMSAGMMSSNDTTTGLNRPQEWCYGRHHDSPELYRQWNVSRWLIPHASRKSHFANTQSIFAWVSKTSSPGKIVHYLVADLNWPYPPPRPSGSIIITFLFSLTNKNRNTHMVFVLRSTRDVKTDWPASRIESTNHMTMLIRQGILLFYFSNLVSVYRATSSSRTPLCHRLMCVWRKLKSGIQNSLGQGRVQPQVGDDPLEWPSGGVTTTTRGCWNSSSSDQNYYQFQ